MVEFLEEGSLSHNDKLQNQSESLQRCGGKFQNRNIKLVHMQMCLSGISLNFNIMYRYSLNHTPRKLTHRANSAFSTTNIGIGEKEF